MQLSTTRLVITEKINLFSLYYEESCLQALCLAWRLQGGQRTVIFQRPLSGPLLHEDDHTRSAAVACWFMTLEMPIARSGFGLEKLLVQTCIPETKGMLIRMANVLSEGVFGTPGISLLGVNGLWLSVTSYPPWGEGMASSTKRCMAVINLHVCYCNANHSSKLWLATAVQFLGKLS